MATNRAYEAKSVLSGHNYVVMGSGPTYFTQFTHGKLTKFRSRYGSSFYLVIIGDRETESDFYIVPWNSVCNGFTDSLLQESPRATGHIVKRWVCHIRRGYLEISKDGFETFRANVGQCKGNDELLNTLLTGGA